MTKPVPAEFQHLCFVRNMIFPRHKWGRDWRCERCGVAMPVPKPERKEERRP